MFELICLLTIIVLLVLMFAPASEGESIVVKMRPDSMYVRVSAEQCTIFRPSDQLATHGLTFEQAPNGHMRCVIEIAPTVTTAKAVK